MLFQNNCHVVFFTHRNNAIFFPERQCICTAHSLGRSALTGSQGPEVPRSSVRKRPMAQNSQLWAFPQCPPTAQVSPEASFLSHVTSTAPLLPNQHPGCWGTKLSARCQSSGLSSSWDAARTLRLCPHKGVPSSHTLCAVQLSCRE